MKPHIFLRDGLWWVTAYGRDRNTAVFGFEKFWKSQLYLQRKIHPTLTG